MCEYCTLLTFVRERRAKEIQVPWDPCAPLERMYRSVRPEGSLDTSAAVVPPTYKCAACLTKSQNSCGCSEPSQRCMSALALRQRASPQHARHVRMAGHEGLRAHDLCHRDCSTWEGRKVSGRAAKRSAAGPWQHEAAGSPSLTEDARDAPMWRSEGQSATAHGEWRPRSGKRPTSRAAKLRYKAVHV